MDIDGVADELYGLPPGEFISQRDARVAQAKTAGDRQLAAAIKALRRPTASAALANLVVHKRPEEMTQLIEFGRALSQAQADLDAQELRRLAPQRHRAIASFSAAARELARESGQPLSPAVILELEGTLEAAVADAGAADALRSGRLTAALRYSGFGPVDLSGAVNPPAGQESTAKTPPQTTKRDPTGAGPPNSPPPGNDQIEAAERELRDAEAAAIQAEADVDEQKRRLSGARQQFEQLHQEVADLEQKLQVLRAAEDRAEHEVHEAETELAAAEQKRLAAQQPLRNAQRPRGE